MERVVKVVLNSPVFAALWHPCHRGIQFILNVKKASTPLNPCGAKNASTLLNLSGVKDALTPLNPPAVKNTATPFKKGVFTAVLFLFVASSLAQIAHENSYTFDSSIQQQQFQTMTEQLRCLVCQNESLWDSQAPLARDLRAEIYQKIKQGESVDQIKQYLVARYGQFILFKPTFNGATYVLWLIPFLLLVCAFMMVGFIALRSKRGSA